MTGLLICLIIICISFVLQIIILIRMYDKDTTELNNIIIQQIRENNKLKVQNSALETALDLSLKSNFEEMFKEDIEEKKKPKRKKAK